MASMPNSCRAFVLVIAAACGLAAHDARAIQLFNGVDLTGWTKLGGGGTYHVENDEIVGTSPPIGSPNTFLVTQSTYANFELELVFKISDTSFNSGVQIRSQSLPSHNGGRVFGYQVEIDPSPPSWTGGIYFEGGSPRRSAGWLDDLSDNPAARAAFSLGQWNRFRILAVDRRIQTWINGVPAVDYTDNHATGFLPSGFIGLQVHSISSGGPYQVRWRDVTLNEIAVPSSTLAITIDPTTGVGRLRNPTGSAIVTDGYSIASASGSLRGANGQWLSLTDQQIPGWEEGDSSASLLAEFNPLGQLSIPAGGSYNLGALFNPAGMRDLVFEYTTPGVPDELVGTIIYRLSADFDADGEVDGFDLARWRASFAASSGADADGDNDSDGNDFLRWQRQLGASAVAATASSLPAPEPSSTTMLVMATVVVPSCFLRRALT